MPTIKVNKTFKFAERGIDVFEYIEGETAEVSDDCAAIAIQENWAVDANGAPGKKKIKPEPQIVDQGFVARETAAVDADQLETK